MEDAIILENDLREHFLGIKKSSFKHVVYHMFNRWLINYSCSIRCTLEYSYSLWNQKLPFLKRSWAVFFKSNHTSWCFLLYDFKYLYNVNIKCLLYYFTMAIEKVQKKPPKKFVLKDPTLPQKYHSKISGLWKYNTEL